MIFRVALFITEKKLPTTQIPPTKEWLNKLRQIHISGILLGNKKELLSHITTQMNLIKVNIEQMKPDIKS